MTLRRRAAVGPCLALPSILLMAACGDAGDAPPDLPSDPFCQEVLPRVQAWAASQAEAHPVPDDPRYGGTAVVGSIAELRNGMNTFSAADFDAVQHQGYVNLMTLIRYDEALRPEPWLAESWEVAEDGGSVTFHLRDDVFWHDGEPTTARDVAFTYLRVTDPATGFPNAAFWDAYVRGEEGVEVLDDYTVRIRMRPHPEFLNPWRTVAIMPAHLLEEVPPEELGQHPYGTVCPVGNGPFVFSRHVPQDRWVFDANPGFPEALGGRPFLDRYTFRVIPEQATLLSELLTGGVDVYIAPSPDQAERIQGDPELELRSFPFRNSVFVAWNTRRPLLSDARVRRALTLATDRTAIVEGVLQGYGTVANSLVPPFHWAHDPAGADALGYDPAAAGRLLDQAGWTDRDGDGIREDADGAPLSLSIKVNTGSRQRGSVAEIMQAQLREVGVEVQVEVVEWNTLLEQITTPDVRDFDGVVMAWVTEFRIDDTDLFRSDRADQPFAFAGIQSPELDRILRALRETMDREAALPLWREYQEVLREEQPYTFLYFPDRLDGVNRRIQGAVMDARGDLVNLPEWWIDPDAR